MIKEIRFTSQTARPSDYDAPDGDLALSLNLLNEHANLETLRPPSRLFGLPESIDGLPGPFTWLCIHDISYDATKNYILKGPGNNLCESFLFYRDKEGNFKIGHALPFDPVSVTPFGNMLIARDSNNTPHYLRWYGEHYTYLGTMPPFVDIEFGLIFTPPEDKYEDHEVSISSPSEALKALFDTHSKRTLLSINEDMTAAEVISLTNTFHATVNSAIAEHTKKGRFCFPFLVRYAYRLFDGSYIQQSSPVLMLPSTDTPNVSVEKKSGNNPLVLNFTLNKGAGHPDLGKGYLNPCRLSFNIMDLDQAGIARWKDLIQSIDIFVTPQLYTYSTDDRVVAAYYKKGLGCFQIPDHEFYGDKSLITSGTVFTPESEQKLSSKISDASVFYKIATIEFDKITELAGEPMQALTLESEDLSNLVTRPTLTDGWRTREILKPKLIQNFNSRLHYAEIISEPQAPPPVRTLIPYSQTDAETISKVKVTVLLNKNGNIIKTVLDSDSRSSLVFPLDKVSIPRFLFYPDPDAFMIILTQERSHPWARTFHFPLKPHDFLNGAYWLDPDMEPNTLAVSGKESSVEDEDSVSVKKVGSVKQAENLPAFCKTDFPVTGRIYVSEVNNPFTFNPTSAVSLPVNRIDGICSAARPLSQGQFGQFPLYAFTDTGVWALELNANGTYSARQPITRDVCTDPDSITQIDSSVLFISDRGLMLLSGSNTECISDPIDNTLPLDLETIAPGLSNLLSVHHSTSLASLRFSVECPLSEAAGKTECLLSEAAGKTECLLSEAAGNTATAGLSKVSTAAPEENPLSIPAFKDFIRGAKILYDYPNQRLLLYKTPLAYVFSLKSKRWGMTLCDIAQNLNSYPEAEAVASDGTILNFSRPDTDVPQPSLLITRPLKLDAPDLLKTVDTVIQRGLFRRTHLSTILYGSRDLITWHPVRTSGGSILHGFRGTPYKYFRLVLLCHLAPGESLSGATFSFAPRFTNRPR